MRRIAARIAIPALLAFTVLLPSCQSTGMGEGGGYSRVQVIDVQGPKDLYSTEADIPLSAVIQPEDLRTSPVIDITTLQILESETDNVGRAKSSLLEQDARKSEIEEALSAGENVDTTLDDLAYGQSEGVPTSGLLALEATEKAFEFIKSPTAFSESIAEYDYIPGRIYELITSPGAITDLRLKPGEQINGNPITNDTTNWQFSLGTSLENGEAVQHLFIRPLKVGLDTSMIILTNERTYYFRMASFENSYMTAVRFRYPQPLSDGTFVAEDFSAETHAENSYSLDLSKVDYAYTWRAKGRPAWEPVTVFSDEIKTYIQFPITMSNSDQLPSVYLHRDGEETLVNYRYVGNICQIDAVLTDDQDFILKSGQKERVEIRRAY